MTKRIIATLLASVVAISAFAGCSKGGTSSAAGGESGSGSVSKNQIEVPSEPQDGGILTVSLQASPKYIDPVKYTGTYESQIIYSMCDTLVDYSMDLSKIIPSLGECTNISEDGMKYTFKIRDDVYFHPGKFQDGRKLTAADIKYSLERSAKESAMNRLDMLASVDVVSDTEVVCNLKTPNSVFLTALTDAGNAIVCKEEVEGWGDQFNEHVVGTGPFMLKEFKLDQEAVLVRNEKYWAQKPHLDGVTFKPISDMNQAANALRTGEIDLASTLNGEAVQIIRQDPDVKLVETPGLHIAYIYFNQVNGPTKDIKVREALIKAIDVPEMTKAIYQYGEAQPAKLPLPPSSWGYDASLEGIVPAYDPEGAKKLLADAGYPDGLSLKLYISNTALRVKMATIVQQYLKTNLNVDLEIMTSEWGTFSETASSGNADIYAMSWTWYPDPFFFLNKLFASSEIGALGNGQGFNNAEVDKLLADALIETDQAARATIYKKALKLITEQMPGVYYANENITWGVRPQVQGEIQRADNTLKICNTEVNIWKVQ